MAFDEGLAERIRDALRATPGVTEKKMFGGICFTWQGNMLVGVTQDRLMARIGEAAEPTALRRKGARPMDFTGKPMKGYVFVDRQGIAEDRDLEGWIDLCKRFVSSLPAKGPTPANATRSTPAKAPARRRAGATPAGKVVVENVNVPGFAQTVDAAMYAEVRRVLMDMLHSKAPGLTQSEMRAGIVPRLSPALFPGGAKVEGWSKLVQLDLEAKGVVVRDSGKPARWRKACP